MSKVIGEVPEVENRLEKVKKVMDMVAADQEKDAREFDGRPFNGRTVAEYFGNQGAAIAALAKAIKVVIEELEKKNG